MSTRESDFGTQETADQAGGLDIGYTAEGAKVGKVRYQNHFDKLLVLETICLKQWQAGDRLRNDADRAHQFAEIRSSADIDPRGNMTDYAADALIDAQRRYRDIISMFDKIGTYGISERAVILKIVIDDGYLTNFSRSAIKLRHVRFGLHSGLNKLIKYYGI